jgi:hypothetical protein
MPRTGARGAVARLPFVRRVLALFVNLSLALPRVICPRASCIRAIRIWAICIGATCLAGSAAADTRVALVIGINAYQNAPPLTNPLNDAEAIGDALRRLNFEVEELHDPDFRTLTRGIRDFGIRAQAADTALVYYAGHGVQVDRENYLIPADAKLERARDLAYEAVPLSLMLDEVSQASKIGIVMLDSCRNNPFIDRVARSMSLVGRAVATTPGLARVDNVPRNTIVVMAAKADQIAEDGQGHSPFAAAILAHLQIPGLELGLFFRSVRDAVLRATQNRQEPYVFSSLGAEPFYFYPRPPNRPPVIGPITPLQVMDTAGPTPFGIPAPTDPDLDPLIVRIIGLPRGGEARVEGRKVTLGEAFSVEHFMTGTFKPDGTMSGPTGTLDILVEDGRGGSAVGSLPVVVMPSNPVQRAQTALRDSPLASPRHEPGSGEANATSVTPPPLANSSLANPSLRAAPAQLAPAPVAPAQQGPAQQGPAQQGLGQLAAAQPGPAKTPPTQPPSPAAAQQQPAQVATSQPGPAKTAPTQPPSPAAAQQQPAQVAGAQPGPAKATPTQPSAPVAPAQQGSVQVAGAQPGPAKATPTQPSAPVTPAQQGPAPVAPAQQGPAQVAATQPGTAKEASSQPPASAAPAQQGAAQVAAAQPGTTKTASHQTTQATPAQPPPTQAAPTQPPPQVAPAQSAPAQSAPTQAALAQPLPPQIVPPQPPPAQIALATPLAVPFRLAQMRTLALRVPCALVDVREAKSPNQPDRLLVSGLTLPGAAFDAFLRQVEVEAPPGLAVGVSTEPLDSGHCTALGVMTELVRRTRERGAMRLTLPSAPVPAGGELVIAAETIPGGALYVDLYAANGSVQHLHRDVVHGGPSEIDVPVAASASGPPGQRLLAVIATPIPLNLAQRPANETQAAYLPALQRELARLAAASVEPRAEVATLSIIAGARPAAPPRTPNVATSGRPANLGNPRCHDIIARVTLGESLSDDERSILRTSCAH